MTTSIERFLILALTVGASGLAWPARAQMSNAGINPVRVEGKASPEKVEEVCGITHAVKSLPLTDSGLGGPDDFKVELGVVGEKVTIEDKSPVDQFKGTPGFEAVALWVDDTNVYCYPTRIKDSGLSGPQGAPPKEITIIWGQGPCLLPQDEVEAVCNAYNKAGREEYKKVDYIVGLKHGPDELNICGCPPVQAQACDATEPPGTSSSPNRESCNPKGEALKWMEGHVGASTGTSSHDQYCPAGTKPVHWGGRSLCVKL